MENVKTHNKICFRCKVSRPSIQGFHVLKNRTNNVCKVCRNKYTRSWGMKNPDKTRAAHLRWKSKQSPERLKEIQDGINRRVREKGKRYHLEKKYGISNADYEEMFDRQKGRCKICKTLPNKKPLYVDHCHNSKIVRGLLCQQCNTGLGMFKDRTKFLQNAVTYLKRGN